MFCILLETNQSAVGKMGNACSRRRHIEHIPTVESDGIIVADEPWVLITGHTPNYNHPLILHFKKVVRRVKHLLRLRRIFARAGSWLNTASASNPRFTRIRNIYMNIWTQWPRTVLRGTKVVFDHLERRRGILVYKSGPRTR